MIEFRPFHIEYDKDDNGVYTFFPVSETTPGKVYTLEITIDGLNDGLILSKLCTCKGNGFMKYECKHLKAAKESLTKFMVDWRELQTEAPNTTGP